MEERIENLGSRLVKAFEQVPDPRNPSGRRHSLPAILTLWYAELVILKLLGYDGYFRDRLDAGGIKRVPWATE